jgi:hypothetical protein
MYAEAAWLFSALLARGCARPLTSPLSPDADMMPPAPSNSSLGLSSVPAAMIAATAAAVSPVAASQSFGVVSQWPDMVSVGAVDAVVERCVSATCTATAAVLLPTLRIVNSLVLLGVPVDDEPSAAAAKTREVWGDAADVGPLRLGQSIRMLSSLAIYLGHADRAVRKEAALVLANLTGLSSEHARTVGLTVDIMTPVIRGLQSELDVAHELLFVVYNVLTEHRYIFLLLVLCV